MRARRGWVDVAVFGAVVVLASGLLLSLCSSPGARGERTTKRTMAVACAPDNGGLTLPAGFCATGFADEVGHARHLVVASSGVGRYYRNDTPPAGGFLVALRDTTGSGRADVKIRFGDDVQHGGAGGTGVALYRGARYAEVNDRIVRYPLPASGSGWALGHRSDGRESTR